MRVLVVDDSSAVRGRLAAMLRDTDGVTGVDEAADLEQALRLASSFRPGFVVLDLHVGRTRGAAVLRALRNVGRGARIAILTNEAGALHRRACLTAGADYFFDKSREFEVLMATVRAVATAPAP